MTAPISVTGEDITEGEPGASACRRRACDGAGMTPYVHAGRPCAAAYSRGCRCGDCTELHRQRQARTLASMRERAAADPSLIPHGTYGGYTNWACRCGKCSLAHSRWQAARRRGRAQVSA